MGLLDQLAGQVMGSLGGQAPAAGGQGALLSGLMTMIDNAGGVQAVLQQLQQSGIADQVMSWIGTGQNLPVSGDQLAAALGQDKVAQVAAQAGVSPDQAAGGLAALLPQIIDQLTPQGQVPTDDMLSQGLNLLRGRLLG